MAIAMRAVRNDGGYDLFMNAETKPFGFLVAGQFISADQHFVEGVYQFLDFESKAPLKDQLACVRKGIEACIAEYAAEAESERQTEAAMWRYLETDPEAEAFERWEADHGCIPFDVAFAEAKRATAHV